MIEICYPMHSPADSWYNEIKVIGNTASLPHLCLFYSDCLSVVQQIEEKYHITDWIVDLTTEPFHTLYSEQGNVSIFAALGHFAQNTQSSWHFLSGIYDVQQDYADWLERTASNRLITVQFMPIFFRRTHSHILQSTALAGTHSPRLFCSFNNRHTHSRARLLIELAAGKLLENGYCTWRFTQFHWQQLRHAHSQLKNVTPYNLPYQFDTGIQPNDNPRFKQNYNTGPGCDSSLLTTYAHTELELVAETYDETEAPALYRFISEKTARPLLSAQPFIAINAVGSWQMLRELGFVDYSRVIDQTYDKEHCEGARIGLAVRSLQQLKKDNFVKTQLKQELAHNQNRARELAAEDTVGAYIKNLIKK